MNPLAIEALAKNQRQLDIDGVEVGVSRQALDELLGAYAKVSHEHATVSALYRTEASDLKQVMKSYAQQTGRIAELVSANEFLRDARDAIEKNWLEAARQRSILNAKVEALEEGVKCALAALVALISLVERAEEGKCRPSRAAPSDAMFRMMLDDYGKAAQQARSSLT